MNIKSILGFATVAIALSLTLPVQSANRKDLQRLLDTGNCPRCDLRDANLRGANLRGANLKNANLRGANLRDANLRGANLSNADLQDADLRDANLTQSNLRNANLEYVDVRGANFDGSDLKGANLKNTDLADRNYRDNDRRSDNYEKVALEFVSRTNDDIRIEIEGDGDTQKIELGGNNNKYRIYLSPQLYRLRFFQGRSRNSWKSGKLDLRRNRSDRMRIYVNTKDRSIQLENDEKAWNSD